VSGQSADVAFGVHTFKVCEVKRFTSVFGREKKKRETQNGGDIGDDDASLS
jgi:hypothetical protein